MPFRLRHALLLSFALSILWGCTDDGAGAQPPPFEVRPGVQTVTVTHAEPATPLTLYDAEGSALVTLITDAYGQAHFAYIPEQHRVFDTEDGTLPVAKGHTLKEGDGYVIRNDSVDPPEASAPFSVLGIDDLPDPSLYESQSLDGVPYSLVGTGAHLPEEGFGYIEMRDGVKLSVMVRFPDRTIWGDGPWPTVIEYSGYSPSRPDSPEPGSRIATLLGYASVGVNMRGSGCSGGVFDVFNVAQHADGYDIVETVARQPWALDGAVGMVGLSYSGIAQLFVASTRPPSLAAITPLSVIADPWEQQWPGGVYNSGFTRQWLQQRDAQASAGGQSWTDERIAAGDEICEAHQRLRNQNIDFESFFRKLEFYPPDAGDRSLPALVDRIETPVYLTGAWQDEQTGSQFAGMLDRFSGTDEKKLIMYNGRHPDGYSPLVLTRWWEFLELYVAGRVPKMDEGLREVAGNVLSEEFGATGLGFEPDRFADFGPGDYEQALAFYESEPRVRVLFENGAGADEPGAPAARFETSYDTWPPPDAEGTSLYLGANGTLTSALPKSDGVDSYLHDPAAGSENFFGPDGYQLMARLWDIDWTQFPEGRSLSYLTEPLAEDLVIAGPGWAELWIGSEAEDAAVQVTISEVRPDDVEYLVQSGWLRIGHRAIDESASDELRIRRSYAEEDYEPIPPGEHVRARIQLPSFAHAFRAGSRLRVVISTPGRNHGTWEFESLHDDGEIPRHSVARGPTTPSRLYLPVVTGVPVAPGLPPCPGLRGQPCRTYVPTSNTTE